MANQELEIVLMERASGFGLKETAFHTLDEIFSAHSADVDFLRGFSQSEIIRKFDGFEYRIGGRYGGHVIITKIGLYIESHHWVDNLEPIGYYKLEADFNGVVLDDWFVIEQEKYLKDIGIISHFQVINKHLPIEYLKRNHIQYEFVSYLSMAGTFFVSKQFEGAGIFIERACNNLATVGESVFETEYLKSARFFLKIMSRYLVEQNLVTDGLKIRLTSLRK